MNILIYHPANQTAKDIEALAEAFIAKGHAVFLLTHAGEGALHHNINKVGGKAFTVNPIQKLYYYNQIKFLVNFCNSNDIDIVYSNLQQCSIISILAQYFVKAKVITCRHHSDSVRLYGSWKERIIDKLINSLSKNIIVISNYSLDQIQTIEKVNPKKVNLIHLGYNFDHFLKPSFNEVDKIKQNYNAKLLLVIVGRLIPLKRVDIAINVVSELVAAGYDIKMLILGTGVLESEFKEIIEERNLNDNVFLIGHVINVEDYIAASDLLIHTSSSEASCHMPKEAGILEKPVLVCENVGDFSDYIINDFNGILIDKVNTAKELKIKLVDVYEKRVDIRGLGLQLKATIEDRFSMKKIIDQHESLLTKIISK